MKTNRFMLGLLLGGASILGFTSCEDRLDIPQNGNVSTQEDYYQTDDEIDTAVAEIYSYWRSQYCNLMMVVTELSDDVMNGGQGDGDGKDYQKLNEHYFDTNSRAIKTLYTNLYTLIYYCNLVIDNVEANSDKAKQAVADAKFFRAYSYYYLATLWGETVPLVDHLLSTDEYFVERSAAGAVWSLVKSDLQDAINVLPSKSSVNDKEANFRVTKEAAEVMLAKAYMWQPLPDYSSAAAQLENVINSGKYALYTGDWLDLFHVEGNNCCEKVLEVQCPDDYSNFANNGYRDSNHFFVYATWAGTRFFHLDQQATGFAGGGWNFLHPREGVYNTFVAEEGVDGYRLNRTMKTGDQMEALGFIKGGVDPMYCHDIYFGWKFELHMSDLMGGTWSGMCPDNCFINYSIIRYAEVLLLDAECQLQMGNNEKAANYLNQVRQRAQLAAKSNITLEDIKIEKRMEFWNEGVRYLDLLRWGDAYEALKDQGKKVVNLDYDKSKGGYYTYVVYEQPFAGFVQGKHELLPIPQTELDCNPNMTQNTGY